MEDMMNLDFSKVCRACLSEGSLQYLFADELYRKLMKCAGIRIWQNDGLPWQICKRCAVNLETFYEFKKLWEETDVKLRRLRLEIKRKEKLEAEYQSRESAKAQNTSNFVFVDCAPENDTINSPHASLEACKDEFANDTINTTHASLGACKDVFANLPNSIKDECIEISETKIVKNIENLNDPQHCNNDVVKGIWKRAGTEDATKSCAKRKELVTDEALKKHIDILNNRCNICNTVFSHKEDYEAHLQTHYTKYKDAVSYKVHMNNETRKKHVKEHKKEKPLAQAPVVCVVCKGTFLNHSDLMVHFATHAQDKPYGCNICDQRYSTITNLEKHKKTHLAL